MKDLYEHLQLGDFEQVRPQIEQYVARTRDYQTNRHALTDEQRQLISERWAAYSAKYGYNNRGHYGG
jgi:hypothetical protein